MKTRTKDDWLTENSIPANVVGSLIWPRCWFFPLGWAVVLAVANLIFVVGAVVVSYL